MPLDLFTPIVPAARQHPNFTNVAAEDDDAVRSVIRNWAEGFVDRDGKFVNEFQRTFNSSFWELYLFAVLKSLCIEVDFSFDAPDFVAPGAELAVEAVIAAHADGATPEWMKTLADLTDLDLERRYLDTMVRLSNSLLSKAARYRDRYARLSHTRGLSYVVAIHNFGTPDAHQLGDVAMQRLLYDVAGERSFLKSPTVRLPTGLFLDDRLSEVSAVLYGSLATFGKARALSNSRGAFLFQATRVHLNVGATNIVAWKPDYSESLRDGLRLFLNPFALRPLSCQRFDVDDIQRFWIEDGTLRSTGHPDGDLCTRQVIRFGSEDPPSDRPNGR
jgi:hypothetical protein